MEESRKYLKMEENKKFADSREFDEWNEKLYKKGVHVRLVFSEEAFEKHLNGASFKELVSELKELQKYDDALCNEHGLQVPPDMLKASFEAYKQGVGMEEIAEQIKEGKYDIPLTEEELAEEKFLAENYFDESLAEGKTFTIYNKETGEKQFEIPLSKLTNEGAYDLADNARRMSGWREFEITDKEGNVLIMGEDSAFNERDGGFWNIKEALEYQEKTGGMGYKYEDIKNILESREKTWATDKPVSKEQVEHTEFQEQAQTRQEKSESGIKNEGRFIKQDIKSHGFKPKPGLVKSISQLNKMTDKSNSVKDISKMYKEKSLQESNPEAQKLVDKIGNELKAQELAKVAPISR